MPITNASIQMTVSNTNKGIINLTQVFKLILTIASEGKMRPVGAKKDIRHIPSCKNLQFHDQECLPE